MYTHTHAHTHVHTLCRTLQVRVVDMYLEEGPKVLYRLAVTCLALYAEGLQGEPWPVPLTRCELACLTLTAAPPGTEDAQSVNVELGVEEFVSSMNWEARGAWFKVSQVTMGTPPSDGSTVFSAILQWLLKPWAVVT